MADQEQNEEQKLDTEKKRKVHTKKKQPKSDQEEKKRKAREEMAKKRQAQQENDELSVEFVGMTIADTPTVPVVKQTGLILDEMCLKHRCNFGSIRGDSECPDRLRAIQTKIKEEGLMDRCVGVPLRPAKDEEIKCIHSDEYLAKLKTIPNLSDEELKSFAESYDSIFLCKESFEVACSVAGGAIDLVKQIQTGQLQNGFAIVRPCGHHAGHNEANGYSLLNNVAIAAKQAVENWNVKRVLVIDWDVHHGQGIQRAFYNDPDFHWKTTEINENHKTQFFSFTLCISLSLSGCGHRVLYFSMHRYENGEFWPHLPESNWDHIGDGEGKGYNINIPWNKTNMGDAEYFSIFQQILLPVALEFKPELVLVAAGFDSAKDDPKGEMAVSPSFYSHMTQSLMGLASGKLALILEGGYNNTSLAMGVTACLKTLLGDPCNPSEPLGAPCQSARETMFNVINQLQPHWRCFQIALSSRHKYLLEISPEGKKEETSSREASSQEKPSGDATMGSISTCRTCLVYDDRMKRHRIGFGPFFHLLTKKTSQVVRTWMEANMSHPERPERISSIFKKHEEYGLVERCLRIEARHASIEELTLCHTESYIKELAETRKLSAEDLDRKQCEYNSIYLCPDSYDCALLATGSLLNVVDTVLTGKSRSGVAIVRPPGHHADAGNPAGFCFFNSAPIAMKHAQKKYNTQRILIVDWDVHHGNGTQNLLERDPGILYISLHRFDDGTFYPGSSGDPHLVGKGPGEGYNINIAWNYGPMGDAEYLAAFRHIIMPIAYEYNPELVLISAGFDAARGDPLGGYDVTPEGYGLMTHMLSSLAGGKVIMVLEGGYNLISISESMARCTHSLLGDPCLSFEPGQPKLEAYGSILLTLKYHTKYWKSAGYQYVSSVMMGDLCFNVDVQKVLFKRYVGDANYGQVSLFLTLLGLFNAFVLWPSILAVYYTGFEYWDWNDMPWDYLCGSAAMSVVFNFLVNFGIAVTFPLFIALGTVVGIPLNAVVDLIFRDNSFGPYKIGGTACIILGFLIMLMPEKWQEMASCCYVRTVPAEGTTPSAGAQEDRERTQDHTTSPNGKV
ncbi:putative histone deacetylase 6 isoform X1 [Apostichopus japonicus]|uniref:Putative histone deacetylase 6 isoform X1 n=1 Tax=Stichopus japonicus TaxID=307972 RepID=A0A2G8KAX0_STIJA|nr:putative histone deacetylase 6 isoform X1 [Apostichopus japonicus]